VSKRLWAIWIKRLLLSLVVVAVAGIVYDRATAHSWDRSPGTAALVAVGLYLAAGAVLGVMHLVAGGLYLAVFADKDITEAVLDDLRRVELPAPSRHEPKTYDYLASLADDEEAAPNDRVRAAVLVGSYSTAMQHGIFRSLALRRAIDAAVLRYAQEAPERY
jgi:hypothetical protein